MGEHDRKVFARLARRGLIPANAVAPLVWLASAAREARTACGSDAMVMEALVQICNRPAIEGWIATRYQPAS